jgi:NhaP-type Na+/H+ or K+/H+ antiporter
MYGTLAALAAFVFVYSVVAGRVERTPISGPVVFLAFGIVAGPFALGLLDLTFSAEALRTVAELTLALVLFTDSANADLATLRRSFRIPQRMLLIGLPLTIALGFGVGVLMFPNLPLLTVAILATMLAPTDAALGKSRVASTTGSVCPSCSRFSPSPPAAEEALPKSRSTCWWKRSASVWWWGSG